MMSMKIWKIITQQRRVLIVFDDMLADMESNKRKSPIITELFLGGKNLTFHFFLSHNLILKCLKL